MKVFKQLVEKITTITYFYLLFYLLMVLFFNIDILEKISVIIIIILLISLNFKIGSIFEFITTTGQILIISAISVILGLFGTNYAIEALEYVLVNSKYTNNYSDENQAIAIVVCVICIWFIFSYCLFYIFLRILQMIKIEKVQFIIITKQHYKVIEAGTVLSGFMSLLVSIIVIPEYNTKLNNFVLGVYLLCLLPFLYFHFNEELIE